MKKIALIVIFSFGISALYFIDQWQLAHWQSEKAIELDAALDLYQARLQSTITTRLNAIESIASLFVLHPNTSPSEFSHFAEFILKFNPPIRAIQYADSDTRVIYVYPPQGNEITIKKPMTLLTDPKRAPFVKQAIQEKKSILQGPFDLRQGGAGAVARFPIFKEENFIGLSIGVYDIPVLANEALNGLNLNQFAFHLKDFQGNIFWSSGNLSDDSLSREILVAGSTWIIVANWLKPSTPPMFPRTLIWFFGLGFLLAVLFSLRIAWKQEQRLKKEVEERTRDLSNSNNSLLIEIAERKQVENALRDSEEYLRAIYEAADNVAFVVTDFAGEDTKILDVSPGAEKIFGYDRNEAIGEKVAIFHPPDIVEDFPKIQAELKKNKKEYSGEAILIRKNGELFPALFTIFPKLSGDGDIVGTIGVSIDITERKKIEEALRSSEETFSKAFQNAPLLMSISSLQDGRYLDVNEAFVRVTGYKRSVAIGSTAIEVGFIKKEDREKLAQELNAKGRVTDIELGLTKADGSKMYCLYSGEIISVSGKQRLLSLAMDITDRKAMETRLLQAQKMESIGNLAGGIAHDFNNLLFPIIGMSELLLEDLPKGSLEYKNAREIFLAGKRAGDLVNQILAFSRQSEHKMAPVRLQNVLKEVLKLSRSTIPTSIKIHEDIHQNCGLVIADPTQIHQVAMNLITNAFHAVEEKNGIIFVGLKEIPNSASQPEQCIRLSVSDNGMGMTQDTIQKVFEPYFTTKEKGKGTGLGLAVVYGIVKEHKGEIKVNSEMGKGTTFNVYLPSMKKSSEIVTVDNVVKAATGSESILLVDDEVSVAKIEGQILSRLGYQVTVKTSSGEALNAFRKNPNSFDMVISDMTMPDMTGDQLSKEILSIKPNTPIIICTGFSENINKEQAEMIGVKGFLMKPVIKSDMAQMVRNVLDESEKS